MRAPPPGLLARAGSAIRGVFAPDGTRSATSFGTAPSQRRVQPAYLAASTSGLVPQTQSLGPYDAIRYMRPSQNLVRNQYRNDNWVKSLINKTCELMVSTGPVPVSKYPELDDLYCMASARFDARGGQDLGSLIRNDTYRDYLLDGEGMIRRRTRRVQRLRDGSLVPERGLLVPVQFQTLSSQQLTTGNNVTQSEGNQIAPGGRVIQGVELDPIECRAAYWPYNRHPRTSDPMGSFVPLEQTRVPANEFYHIHVPSETGAVRPDVPLAAGILRALKNFEFEDANIRNMLTSQYLSIMLEEDLPDGEEGPDEEEMRSLIDDIVMSPGMIGRLPAGVKAKMMQPPPNANFQQTVRLNLLYLCAGMGTPVHEVTGDVESITERAMSFAGISMRRKADIEHSMLEHQFFNPSRVDFVDAAVAVGLWTPPPGRPLWEAYMCEWQWPAMQITRQSQEIAGMLKAIDANIIDPDTVTTSMFGIRPEVRDRRAAKAAARAATLGLVAGAARGTFETPVAQRVLAEAEAEETRERDIVDAASGEDSVLDDDKV